MSHFDQISTFIEVAESRSFATASRRLELSTSTVSARVKALEERLKVRLLNRNTRNVTLTDEGAAYLADCRDALSRLLAAEDAISKRTPLSGRIRMTVPLNLPADVLAHLLTAFSGQHPRVDIDVTVTDDPLDLIEENIDVALRGRAPGSLSVVARCLAHGRLGFYASQAYIDTFLAGHRLEDLSGHRVLDPLDILPSVLPPDGVVPPKAPVTTRNLQLAQRLCGEAQGIAILPRQLALAAQGAHALQELDVGLTLPELPLYLVYPSRHHLPRRVRALIDFILAFNARGALVPSPPGRD